MQRRTGIQPVPVHRIFLMVQNKIADTQRYYIMQKMTAIRRIHNKTGQRGFKYQPGA